MHSLKGQASLEYLLLLGAVALVTVVAITLVLGIAGVQQQSILSTIGKIPVVPTGTIASGGVEEPAAITFSGESGELSVAGQYFPSTKTLRAVFNRPVSGESFKLTVFSEPLALESTDCQSFDGTRFDCFLKPGQFIEKGTHYLEVEAAALANPLEVVKLKSGNFSVSEEDVQASKAADDLPEFAAGEIIVKFKGKVNERAKADTAAGATKVETDKESVNALLNKYKAKEIRGVITSGKALQKKPDFANIKKIEIDGDVKAAAAEFAQDPNVEYAEPNFVQFSSFNPNDQKFSEQWALQKIQAQQGWDTLYGSPNTVIAIIDTGVDYGHEDLAANMLANCSGGCPQGTGYDFVNTDTAYWLSNGFTLYSGEDYTTPDNNPSDFVGHGTHVAGIAAGVTNNTKGIAGVCPECSIMPVKAGFGVQHPYYCPNGCGVLELDAISNALVYATDNSADVINMSFGGSYSSLQEDAINYAFNAGVVLVASAGNSGNSTPNYPAALANVISVSATTPSDLLAPYSSFGNSVDVAAPGGDGTSANGILNTLPKTGMLNDASGYGKLNGTSMASPHVAGLAGLIISAKPTLSNIGVGNIIRNSADDLGTAGFDSYYGYGRINLLKASYAFDSTNQPPLVAKPFVRMVAVGPGKAGNLGRLLEFKVGIQDPDDPSTPQGQLVYSGTGMPPSATLDASTGIFSWKPAMNELGTYQITFTAVEAGGQYSASQNITISTLFKPETRVTPFSGDQQSPDVSGGKVVWSDSRNDASDVYMYDISAGGDPATNSQPIAVDSQFQWFPAIDVSKIVWNDYRSTVQGVTASDVFMKDISTSNSAVQLTPSSSFQGDPDISGNTVVWTDYRNDSSGTYSNGDIYMKSLPNGNEMPVTTNSAHQTKPKIDGSTIVWADFRAGNGYWDIYTLYNGKETRVSSFSTNWGNANPHIYGSRIVWQGFSGGAYNIYMKDLAGGVETKITNDFYGQDTPAIFEDKVVWRDSRAGGGNGDIYLYDLLTGVETQLTVDPSNQLGPEIDHENVVWTDERNGGGNRDVYMTQMYFAPEIVSIQQNGNSITIDGYNFGYAQAADSSVQFSSGGTVTGTATISSWSNTKIVASAPSNSNDTITLNTKGGKSNPATIGGGPAPVCGNSACEAGEDATSCPADCGVSGPVCGNNVCEAGEDSLNCALDCPAPPSNIKPAAPTNLSAIADSAALQIGLYWTDNSQAGDPDNETSFIIERGVKSKRNISFQQIATAGPDEVSFTDTTDTGLKASTAYYYRVKARNAYGDSAYTNNASATTPSGGGGGSSNVPAAPSGLSGTALSSSEIELSWTDNSGNEDGFSIERSVKIQGQTTVANFTVGSGTESFNDSGLQANTSYKYAVKAFNQYGSSAEASVTVKTSR